MDSFFKENDITWSNCIGLCTDGAHSMSGHKAGLQALVKKKAPHAIWTHCMLHRAALVSKNMSVELNDIFTKIIKIINYIKNSPLRSRLFAKLCVDMEANYTSLLYYCEVRWLSRAKAIQRVFELKEEIAAFLEENHHEEAHLWTNDNFLVKLAYLVEIFGKLSSLNKSMQGSQMHPLVQKDKVKAFIKKLKLWKSNLQKNELDMFSLSKDFWATVNIETSKNLFIEHLDGLVLHFSNYFKDLDFSKFLWVQNPFIDDENHKFELTTIEKEKLIELSCDSLLKQKFQNETLIQFWMNLKGEYESLYCKAMQVLLPFVTSYLCETGFSALAAMKTKYRNRVPYPFVKASQYSCSVLIKPTTGDFLNEYLNSKDLHIGVTTSTGIIIEFDKKGLQKRAANWNQCLLIGQLPSSWGDHWDETLLKICKQPIWTSDNYKEDSFNCYTFVLAFLSELKCGLMSEAAVSRTAFCEKFIVPRTTAAGKYISLYRRLRDNPHFIHWQENKKKQEKQRI